MEIENLPDDLKVIATMWNDGRSGAQIAMEMGISRNSVMGKIFRLRNRGYNLREQVPTPKSIARKYEREACSPIKKRPLIDRRSYFHVQWTPPAAKIEKPRIEITNEPAKPLNVTLYNLRFNSCRYVMGDTDGVNTIYCGAPRKRGAYCAAHGRLCYVAPPKRPVNDGNDASTQSAGAG